jgi:carbon monoxide dehydrogenase subunit G
VKLEQFFEVAAPIDRVWQALVDVEHVAPCLPGAAVTGRNEDGSYNGTLTIKIGPTTASYSGRLEMEQIDEATRSATMQAQGTDKRGQGGAKATITSRLLPADGNGTRVEVVTDLHITGRLARFGRGGMMEDISERLLKQFAEKLQASLTDEDAGTPASAEAKADAAAPAEPVAAPAESPAAPEAPSPPVTKRTIEHAEPIEALSLTASVLWDRVKRNPAPLAFVIGLLLALRFARRRSRRRANRRS